MAKRNGWITVKGIFMAVAIIVIAGLIVGGLYVARDRSESAKREEAIKTAQEKLDEIASNEVKDPEVISEGDKNSNKVDDFGSDTEESSEAVANLPETGSAESIAALIAAATITYSAAFYVKSQRTKHQYL